MSNHSDTSRYDVASSHQPFAYAEDYDDVDLVDLPLPNRPESSLADLSASAEKTVRRRSSKACDQCRKSKCKCERTTPGEPCKSCIMLGVACTFLGPSRKRGPPKGYIDAIEARLHQTEALLGILISASDSRAQTLLRDLAKDPLAREIINRVDNSPYGVKGRKRDDSGGNTGPKSRFSHITAASNSDNDIGDAEDSSKFDLTSTHPSNEWQDKVGAMLSSLAKAQQEQTSDRVASQRPNLRLDVQGPNTASQEPPRQRQRRRLESDKEHRYAGSEMSPPSAMSSRRPESLSSRETYSSLNSARLSDQLDQQHVSSRATTPDDRESDGDLTGAVGQLSINEDAQLRYHSKLSGLHLLSDKVKVETRNEGGLWRFPKARVWPALPSGAAHIEAECQVLMPDITVQEHLLDLYFMYVHPCFPVIHKDAFFDAFQHKESSPDTGSDKNRFHSPLRRQKLSISPLLLFAMFSLASRYGNMDGMSNGVVPAPHSDPTIMWDAGDEYLDGAKRILDGNYATARPTTCQALLLLGYREIGIGAMAQAWTYIGMAIRMAQDLGMHRCADKWDRVDLGGKLFGDWELNERKRIWYGCVIMDKYVSTYIGRPLMIFEQDFDTLLPDENDPEEWTPREFLSSSPDAKLTLPVPGRIISCFNASASLSNILGRIVDEIYAVRPQVSRQTVLPKLEGLLGKWYLELPEHLQFDPSCTSTRQKTVLPHVLTLHLQYWCAVLLLHRAFVRHIPPTRQKSPEDQEDPDSRALAVKNAELCAAAANHITSIVSLYRERFPLTKAPVFLCYYVFTASISHASRLSTLPDDPQAQLGLAKCMEVLEDMQIVWPSAARALELMSAAKASLKEGKFRMSFSRKQPERAKRPAAYMEDSYPAAYIADYSVVRQQPAHHRSQAHISYVNDPNVYNSNNIAVDAIHQHHASPYEAGSQPLTNTYSGFQRWMPHIASSVIQSSEPPLSTSVLPQLYSTGLVEESVANDGHRIYSHASGHEGSGAQGNRQPQHWNDCSAYSQLGPAYGELDSLQPQMPHQQLYMSGQYGLYS
ncbi:hypothetical protein M378DRAFT_75687 [Amanita muscaria Koide BX008]|uniref:Zn(2)-C6 fungal-type domain-containing protein n=1 Tax=Amanita muscaria (strain Koide BX008) TaxID=946122 RepID=A0A0C2WWH2_AMAMK|nr:hypothetical protein M378DRAFT_75687 [Amanita muscaria Koide BX008]